jgi:hypothetical protein
MKEAGGKTISVLAIILAVTFLLGITIPASFAISTNVNGTQVSTSSSTSSSIHISFDLPTAAVVTFVLVLLGLAAALLLMQRFSYTDQVTTG